MTNSSLCFIRIAVAAALLVSAIDVTAQVSATTNQPASAPAVSSAAKSPADQNSGSMNSLVGQPVTHFNFLTLVVGYLATTLIGLFGFVILWRIFSGKIDISLLISEANGTASLSRFQFLIFTFVISLSLLLVILGSENGPEFPKQIPAGIYALLGISAASYVVSKGIQSGGEKGGSGASDDYRVPPDSENAG